MKVYTVNQSQFFAELSELLEKHKVAVCSGYIKDSKYTHVSYLFGGGLNPLRFDTNRQHNSAHEHRRFCREVEAMPLSPT